MSRRFMLTRYAVAVVVATISVSGIPGHSREISESSLDSTASSTLQWPIRNAVESQPFAGTDGGQKGRFHTGSDIVPSPSVYLFNGNTADESNYSVEVFPAASGMVVMAQEMPAPGTPGFASWCKTEQPDPATARPGSGCRDHGLGSVVILWHPDLRLFTLYGHLDSLSAAVKQAVGKSIDSGVSIGKMGHSGSGIRRRWNGTDDFRPHVHFEVKYNGVLASWANDESCDSQCWGYSPKNPAFYGWLNP